MRIHVITIFVISILGLTLLVSGFVVGRSSKTEHTADFYNLGAVSIHKDAEYDVLPLNDEGYTILFFHKNTVAIVKCNPIEDYTAEEVRDSYLLPFEGAK